MLREDIKENSKPLLLKRFICDGFDIVSALMVFMLVMWLLMKSPLANNYHYHVERYQTIEQEILSISDDANEINKLLKERGDYQEEVFAANLHSFLLQALAGLIDLGVLVLIVPLANDGLTIGKSLTSIILFDENKQTKASKGQVVGRFIFIYLSGLMLYPWTGIYTFALVGVIRLIVILLNKKNKTLCDFITSTMLIEKLSYRSLVN